MLDLLNNDAFSVTEMTTAMNDIQVAPARFKNMNLFVPRGIRTTSVGIEEINRTLRVIPTQPRGTMPEYKTDAKRSLRAINVPHIPKNDAVIADALQNVRAFNDDPESTQLESPVSAITDKLEELKQEHELTKEYHRIGALQGIVLDADGTTPVINWFTEFGVSRITVNWDTTDTNGLKKACIELRRKMGEELKSTQLAQIMVEASPGLWDMLMTSDETIGAFSYWQENSFQRDGNFDPFSFAQINFEELLGGIGTIPWVPDDEGFSFPLITGSKALYEQLNAPGTFMEAVNTVGQEYYAKQEPMKFDTGVEIHTQSNPLFIVKKPRVLIRITMSG